MPFRPLLLVNISLIKNDKLDYFSAFMFLVLVGIGVLAGVWLWLIGLDLVRDGHPGRRAGGALVLALAATYSLALAGLVYWEAGQLLEIL
jgi:hypothetical protein